MLQRVLFSARPDLLESRANQLLALMFFSHYVYRSLVYPFRMRSGKPVSFHIFAMALLYCAVNGYLQSSALLQIYVRLRRSFLFWLLTLASSCRSTPTLGSETRASSSAAPSLWPA